MQRLLVIALVLIFGIPTTQVHASSGMTISDVYSRVESRLMTTFSQKPRANQPYYQASLKSESPRIHLLVYAFPDQSGIVKQLRFEMYVCGTHDQPYPEDELSNEFGKFVIRETEAVLLTPIEVETSDLNKIKGTDVARNLSLKTPIPGVRKLRLKRGAYKCDSTGGYGFSLDAFLTDLKKQTSH